MTNKTPNKTKTPVGGLILGSDPIEFNAGRKTITLKVRNTGDRPIQVGSHFHFFEVNRALEQLNPRERDILKMFFGIGCQEMTLEEIGAKFDLTRERVRQIKEKAIRRLKGQKSKLLKSYLG